MRELLSLVRGLPITQQATPAPSPPAQPQRFASTEETLAFFSE